MAGAATGPNLDPGVGAGPSPARGHTMRYLGRLGVAAQVASRAESDTRATTGRPAEDLLREPGLPEEQAAAWRAWAADHAPAGRPPSMSSCSFLGTCLHDEVVRWPRRGRDVGD